MRYSPLVKHHRTFVVALACCAIVSMQMAGLHQHADASQNDMGVHSKHLHAVDVDGHDHGAAIDVTLLDLGMLWSKHLPGLMMMLPVMLTLAGMILILCPSSGSILALRRRPRWRPPLRAPPLSS